MINSVEYIRSIMKADKKRKISKKRIIFYLSLVASLSLLAVSIGVINYSPLQFNGNGETIEIFAVSGTRGRVNLSVTLAAFTLILVSGFGIVTTFVAYRAASRYLFEKRDWLDSWKKLGEV